MHVQRQSQIDEQTDRSHIADHTVQEPRYRRDHRAMHNKFRYLSEFTAASRGFHCDSNAFELNNSINHGKITVLNISIAFKFII